VPGRDRRNRVEKDVDALPGGEARGEADERAGPVEPVPLPERLDVRGGRPRHDDGRRDDRQTIGVAPQQRRVVGVVLGVRDDPLGEPGCDGVRPGDDALDDAVDRAGGQTQVAVVGEDSGPADGPCTQRENPGLELGKMDAHDVVRADLADRLDAVGRHDHALADPEGDRHADDAHTVGFLQLRQGALMPGREDGHLVAALGENPGEALDVDRQPAQMRAVVGECQQHLHRVAIGPTSSSPCARTQGTSDESPVATSTRGCQAKSASALRVSQKKTAWSPGRAPAKTG
jgi:hypothetical protein